MRILKKKNCQITKTKRNGREKTKKSECRREIVTKKTKNLNESRKLKKIKDEKEMWARLKELNHNFGKMEEQKKKNDNKKKKLYVPYVLFVLTRSI